MTTRPSALRAARPMVWIREVPTGGSPPVGVQDGHQGQFGRSQALAEQVDAHQHVEGAQAQVADDLHALDGVDVVVHVAHLMPALSDRRRSSAIFLVRVVTSTRSERAVRVLISLMRSSIRPPRAALDFGVQEAGVGDHLLHDLARPLPFIVAGVAEMYTTWLSCRKFVKLQRPVVEGAGQAEAVSPPERSCGPCRRCMARTWGRVTWLVDEKDETLGK